MAVVVLMIIGHGRMSAVFSSGKNAVMPVIRNRPAPESALMTVDSLISSGAYDTWVVRSAVRNVQTAVSP